VIVRNRVTGVQENGFAIVSDVLSADETTALTSKLTGLEAHRSRAGFRHLMTHPVVRELVHDSRLHILAQQVLGVEAFAFRVTLFDKSPDSNWLITWHQDTALPLQEKRETPGWGPWSVKMGINYAHAPADALVRVVALRLHLDDCTEENGPLRVLPGTHTLGVLSDEEVEKLAAQTSAVTCLVPRGGVLLMRPLLIHASSKLQTEAPRRVLHIEYASSQVPAEGLRLALA
jgi:ectoine hydroxylase-related dioxygenase (phytanoyl-CoA dioxygenase family)